MWAGKGALELGGVVKKMLGSTSDEVMKGVSHWWGGKAVSETVETGGKELAERIAQETHALIEKLPKTMHAGIVGELGGKVEASMMAARGKISAESQRLIGHLEELKRTINSADEEIKLLKTQKDDVLEQITMLKEKGISPEDMMKAETKAKEYVNAIDDKIMVAGQKFKAATAQEANALQQQKIVDLLSTSLDKGDTKTILQLLTTPSKERDFAYGLVGGEIGPHIPQILRAHGGKSIYLNNPKKFLEEFVNYGIHNKPMAEAFAANPDNAAMIMKIERANPNMIDEMVKAHVMKTPFRAGLMGITDSQRAARLGVPVAALAGGYGAMKVYDWLNTNDPTSVASNGQSIGSVVESIKTTGQGQVIVDNVKASLANLINIANQSDAQMADPNKAPQAMETYITGVSGELNNIVQALSQWKTVEDNCSNPEVAENAEVRLYQYVQNIDASLGNLNKSVAGGGGASVAAKETIAKDPNIARIQKFINVPQTGQLDKPTITALRAMEQDFARRTGSKEWYGAFVVPEANHVVSYENLIEAQQRVLKY